MPASDTLLTTPTFTWTGGASGATACVAPEGAATAVGEEAVLVGAVPTAAALGVAAGALAGAAGGAACLAQAATRLTAIKRSMLMRTRTIAGYLRDAQERPPAAGWPLLLC